MLKLELNEVQTILQIIGETSFKGKDIPMMSGLIEKLQKEGIKLQPKGNDGKK
tara:strand:- start:312 stop:470 length:159 start_codon:yes stop_codon:yes gene_type:complete